MFSSTEIIGESIEFKYCDCGCGKTRARYDKQGREYRFIHNHHVKMFRHSEESKKKLREAKLGEKNPTWLGDNVSYDGLHCWVKRHFPKPELCMLCLKVPPKDLACITGIYNRELRNWAYFCQRCHCKWDNTGARNKITWKQNRNNLT